MAPKGGTFLFLLIVTCAALAPKPNKMLEENFDDMTKKLMRECQSKEYEEQAMSESSDMPSNGNPMIRPRFSLSSLSGINLDASTLSLLGGLSLDDTDDNDLMNPNNLAAIMGQMDDSTREELMTPSNLAAIMGQMDDSTKDELMTPSNIAAFMGQMEDPPKDELMNPTNHADMVEQVDDPLNTELFNPTNHADMLELVDEPPNNELNPTNHADMVEQVEDPPNNELNPTTLAEMIEQMKNFPKNESMDPTTLANIIQLMENYPEEADCYIKATVATQSWKILTENGENKIDLDNYDTLLRGARPVLLDMPPSRMNLPDNVKGEYMEKWMMMFRGLHGHNLKEKGIKVLKWAKEQFIQYKLNCTMKPKSDQKSKQLERCPATVQWLDFDALKALGPFISDLKTRDVDSSPKEELCKFFSSGELEASLEEVELKPSLAKKFLQKTQECFDNTMKFEEQMEKLGKLAYYYNPSQQLSPDLSKKLLSELEQCDNDGSRRKLKKRLMNTWLSNGDVTSFEGLDNSITLLPVDQLSRLPGAKIKKALKKIKLNAKWKDAQLKTIFKTIQGQRRCEEITSEELMDLGSVIEGLPRCVLKHLNPRGLLSNIEGLKTISKKMRKGQLKTMLWQLRNEDPIEVLKMLPERMLNRVSLGFLEKANISVEQMRNKEWNKAQASLLVEKLFRKKLIFRYRKLRSLLQGMTCKRIEDTTEKDLTDMVQDSADTTRWLPKRQIGCAARKLFSNLEKDQPDYFETITEEELENIPTVLLLRLEPKKVKKLPDTVCSVLLEKMENANLSSVPLHAPSRRAFTERALLCLTNGIDSSVLVIEDIEKLGPFLCELSPLQMRLMEPDVLTYSLEEMARMCKHIPWRHREDLVQLVIETYGGVSEWSQETMEELGPLVVLDNKVLSALPNKPWMKDTVYFLKPRLYCDSIVLGKKLFDLTVDSASIAERRKRTVENGSPTNARVPTAEIIEELKLNNVFWDTPQIDQISVPTFTETVETLGTVPNYSPDQVAILIKKAVEAFGPVSQMNEDVVTQLGCISQGFSNQDLQTLPFSLDTLEKIGPCGWSDSQMEVVWQAAAKYNNLTAEQLGAAEMVSLNRFICGLDSSEMKQINMEAFKEAVDSMNDLQCSFKSTQQLTRLAVSAFGPPRNWTKAVVSTLGNLVAGLDPIDLASLDPSVLSFFSSSSIQLIPPKNFAAFSVDQLLAFGPDNAAVVTSDQRAAIGVEKQSALKNAMEGARSWTKTTPSDSAPSLTVEGILSLMKPLLFLFMGFLLL
ncbi:otoancorin [Halichoeres trimaculatus]|uniref:otoancorin n=1 Tax=Halichoeres trimaculatus TaxID=147232 RepID=UPI003D9DD128